MEIKQATATTIMMLAVDSTDHTTPETGLTLTLEASKAGGAFAAITPTVTERGNGWYAVTLDATHSDTVGDLVLRITNAGAEGERLLTVVANLEADTYSALNTLLTTALTEAYAADGSTASVAQLLYMIWSRLAQFGVVGTALTTKQLDGATTAMTFTLDSATAPTSAIRSA